MRKGSLGLLHLALLVDGLGEITVLLHQCRGWVAQHGLHVCDPPLAARGH